MLKTLLIFNLLVLSFVVSVFLAFNTHLFKSKCPTNAEGLVSGPIEPGGVLILRQGHKNTRLSAMDVSTTNLASADGDPTKIQFNFNLLSGQPTGRLDRLIRIWLHELNAPWIELGIVKVPSQKFPNSTELGYYWRSKSLFLEGPGRYRVSLAEKEDDNCLPGRELADFLPFLSERSREGLLYETEICLKTEWLGPPILVDIPVSDDEDEPVYLYPEEYVAAGDWSARYVYLEEASLDFYSPRGVKRKGRSQRDHNLYGHYRYLKDLKSSETAFKTYFIETISGWRSTLGGSAPTYYRCGPAVDITKLEIFPEPVS